MAKNIIEQFFSSMVGAVGLIITIDLIMGVTNVAWSQTVGRVTGTGNTLETASENLIKGMGS